MTPGRKVAGIVVAVFAGLAAALAPVAGWTHALLSDSDTFGAAYSPVVRSSAMQQVVTTKLTDAVVTQFGVADNATIRTLVTSVVADIVASEAFTDATIESLQLAREQLLAQLTGEYADLQLEEGVVQLPYAPYVAAVQQALIDAGLPVIAQVPDVTGGITVLTIDPASLPLMQAGYRVLDLASAWLPWLALGLAIATIWVWPGVREPVIGLGLSLLGGAAVVGLGWFLTIRALDSWLGADLRPVAGMITDATGSPVVTPLLVIGALGAVLAIGAWLSGRLRGDAADATTTAHP